MSTWLDIKNSVAANLGKLDGSTYNAKRENAINRARRKFYSEYPWSFTKKVGASIALTSQTGDIPSDACGVFDPIAVYTYSGPAKYSYSKVEWDDLESYGSGAYVFALDQVNGRIRVSQDIPSVSVDYQYLPADITATDSSHDTDVEPAPSTEAIELLATAYFYLSSRGQKGSYQLFHDLYKESLAGMESQDAEQTPPRMFSRHSQIRMATGYNLK